MSISSASSSLAKENAPKGRSRANRLLSKIPNPDALRGTPDPLLIARMKSAIAQEQIHYVREMRVDVDKLIGLLRSNATKGEIWPLAHELRSMAGTYSYLFLTHVTQLLCRIIQNYESEDQLSAEVSIVFADTLQRGALVSGAYSRENEVLLQGLRAVTQKQARPDPPPYRL